MIFFNTPEWYLSHFVSSFEEKGELVLQSKVPTIACSRCEFIFVGDTCGMVFNVSV